MTLTAQPATPINPPAAPPAAPIPVAYPFELLFARFYMWLLVFNEVYIKKNYHKDGWERVESTK